MESLGDARTQLPDNDGLARLIDGKRSKTTGGGESGVPVPMTSINEVGKRTYEWFWLGNTFVCPVSDGEHVYTLNTLGGVVACFDLDGRRLWARSLVSYETDPNHTYHATHELYLHGNLLFLSVERLGKGAPHITVLDTATDRTVVEHDWDDHGIGAGQIFFPMVFDGETFLIIKGEKSKLGCPVLRASDGAHVATITDFARESKFFVGPNRTGGVVDGHVLYAGLGNYYFKKDANGAVALAIEKNGMDFNSKTLWRSTGQDSAWRGVIAGADSVFMVGHDMQGALFAQEDGTVRKRYGGRGNPDLVKDASGSVTNDPVYAAGRYYIPGWSGVIAVIDARSGEVLAENLTEPIWGGTIFPHGARAYLRGLTSLYCLE